MSWELLSPILIVGFALVFIGLERVFPYDPRQKLFRRGFFTDLVGYAFVQSYFLGLAISALIRFIDTETGLSRLGLVSRLAGARAARLLLRHPRLLHLLVPPPAAHSASSGARTRRITRGKTWIG